MRKSLLYLMEADVVECQAELAQNNLGCKGSVGKGVRSEDSAASWF